MSAPTTSPASVTAAGGATARLHDAVLTWYDANARELPWRAEDRTAWGVLVSEVMLQQTPVARVLPAWREWMHRWPTPADLAADAPGEAVRAWGRLGYPRRALRLHAAAVALTERHRGQVPADLDDLLALPGIGAYTAAAVASFAFGARHAVLDTNVRRVLARAVEGHALPARSLTVAETALAESLLPDDPATAARWAVAVMELGALVCTARTPRCGLCPVAGSCAWLLAGRPAPDAEGPRAARVAQRWDGTDRQMRGLILAVLRDHEGPVPGALLREAVPHRDGQRERCLDSLVADGLVEPLDDDRYRLPA